MEGVGVVIVHAHTHPPTPFPPPLLPYMSYLKVNWINNMPDNIFVRMILEKTNDKCNRYLHLLCVQVPTANDETIKKRLKK